MKRARTSLLRRIVMWAAAIVLTLSVAAWVVSMWGISLHPDIGISFDFQYGNLILYEGGGGMQPNVEGFQLQPEWMWPWPATFRIFGVRMILVPLWLPTSLSGVLFLLTWLPGRKRRRFQRAGLCPTCGYDLSGITGPCPECGSEKPGRGT